MIYLVCGLLSCRQQEPIRAEIGVPKTKTLRVHSLAKELGVTSKQVIEKCHAEDIELKNHMAAISLGLAESIREWFSVGEDVTSIEVAGKVDLSKVRKPTRKNAKAHEAEKAAPAETAEKVPTKEETPIIAEPSAEDTGPAQVIAPEPDQQTEVLPKAEEAVLVSETGEEPPLPEIEELAARTDPPEAPVILPEPPSPSEPVIPAGPQVVPKPAELQGPRVVRVERPEPIRVPRPRPRPAAPSHAAITEGPVTSDTSTSTGSGKKSHGRGRGPGDDRDSAAARSRSPRRRGQGSDIGEREKEWRDQDLLERKERLASATGHGLKERRAVERRRVAAAAAASGVVTRKAPVELTAPITLKELCGAVGIPFSTISKQLMEQTGALWMINQSIDAETLELLALDLGVPVTIEKQKTALERLQDEFERRGRDNLQPRPPVVAMLGHVDHGKTSLLDAIRHANVAHGEAGGITQHIGAYRVDHDGWRVTFLDTPGHEAFTAMRARGANLTDVVVLVVAADDGVMPQTLEAINHTKAAGVQIVIALNKIDLPSVDLNRIYSQLAEHDLAPAEWGGETDLIKTSATTGEGIKELIAHLSTLSDLMNLNADPTIPAQAIVIEAQMREGQGVAAQVLVREGTIRIGQAIVCGGGSGRVRTLRDDKGKRVKEALPGWPVEVIGLDELPQAGDRLYQLDDLKQAKLVAEETRQQRRSDSLGVVQKPRTLEEMLAAGDEAQVSELNLVVKADVQGSVDVLKKSLGQFPSDKAQLKILHSAVGAISEADIHLARASDAIVVGFHIVAEDRARQLADELGVEIRLYRVIYEILDDMHKALAGLLEPIRNEEQRGAAEVRQVFNVSRLGTVAGCYVSSGTIARNHQVRLVRDGRIVLEGGTIQSLKRFKDDVRDVRTGLECGIKLKSFNDVKPGDVIETYEIVEVAQEL